MSLPVQGGVKVRVAITAAQAAQLAWTINFMLSQSQEFQEAIPEFWTSTNDEHTFWQRYLTNALRRFAISEDVTLEVLPDQRTPGTSGYFNYSGPHPDQYVQQGKGLWLGLLSKEEVE